ncbi:hypothetical protein PF005_g12065 [Phytophthora fragariae]|uniref:Secreted protein n=1 Tax=Phytophthora fragariae TaxID=53985 RepID=A0A6A3EKX6_9STRA|nr:hypothetical protein PF003_g6032 [Phytophthora fragariae]KAE8933066.1 hypothetical protein PF009_g16920 [Phytophthora fragariae]KAE8998504.1 hypothetical protein PF011_g15027 [Phytophthora fragariae]KAE9098638.1 hypothetical protein PF007_g16192 [Phytophthora fragariae]KAE9099130.1 hypothetical protein PF010_g15306 [Phytophthora fragariae]
MAIPTTTAILHFSCHLIIAIKLANPKRASEAKAPGRGHFGIATSGETNGEIVVGEVVFCPTERLRIFVGTQESKCMR